MKGWRTYAALALMLLAAFAYLAATLPELVDGLKPARWISPFWYGTAGNPLVGGFVWWHALVLLAAALVVLGLGSSRFGHRNLTS